MFGESFEIEEVMEVDPEAAVEVEDGWGDCGGSLHCERGQRYREQEQREKQTHCSEHVTRQNKA
jgi:hypothetical protein